MAIRKTKKRESLLDFGVNITSLLDVMVILIFFLIKSFAVSSSALETPKGIRLPTVISKVEASETVKVSISSMDLKAENKRILSLINGRIPGNLIDPNDSRTIIPLKKYLQKQREKKLAIYKGAGNISFIPPGKVLIQADKELPFSLLKYIFHTAAVAGYSDYQLVVAPVEQ